MTHTIVPDAGTRSALPLTVSVNEAIAMIGIGRTRLYELIASGDIKTVKIGRRRLVQVESLRAIASAGVSPPTKPTAYVCPEQIPMPLE